MISTALKFKRVIVYARHHRANVEVVESLERVLLFLKNISLPAFLDKETSTAFEIEHPALDSKDIGQTGDVIVVIGGDGSLLSAARMAVAVGVPVVGVNRGKLGFLTDISPHHLEQELLNVLGGKYIEEQRFLLDANIESKDGQLFQSCALNDIVVSQGLETHLMEFEVMINDTLLSHYYADGIIFSTPTGSTAYALSAGGPIMHPQLNVISIVPMFPHRLSSRPIVISADTKITLKPAGSNELSLLLSADSHAQELVRYGQWINISKHPSLLKLLHPISYDYYDTLRRKLGWEASVL